MQHSGCGCNTVCCGDVSQLCCAEADVPEDSSGGTDVGGGWIRLRCRCGPGMDSFAVQRWARDRLSPIADVGGCVWAGGGLGPGAEVDRYAPSPVVSDERSPKCRSGLIGVSCTKLQWCHRSQHHARVPRVRACAQQRLPHWKRRIVVGTQRSRKPKSKPKHTKARVLVLVLVCEVVCVWLCCIGLSVCADERVSASFPSGDKARRTEECLRGRTRARRTCTE